MFKQKSRRACLNAIKSKYEDRVGLLADRRGPEGYWSVWACGEDRLLEVTQTKEKISIFEFVSNH